MATPRKTAPRKATPTKARTKRDVPGAATGGAYKSGNHPPSRKSLTSEELTLRRYQALQWRIEGVTFREIAKRQEINVGTAYEDVQTALREREDGVVARLRRMEELRLDRAIEAAFEVLNANRGTELALKAVDRVIRASHTRAGLLGLNAPVELNVRTVEKTQADLELEELLREADARNAVIRERLMAQAGGDDGQATSVA